MTGREEIEQAILLAGPIYDDAAAIDAIERIIRKRAAAELRAAADWADIHADPGGGRFRIRAAELDPS